MRNPCAVCENALLDKNKCSLGCVRRHEYCKYLGISITGVKPSPTRPPYKPFVPFVPVPPPPPPQKPPKPPEKLRWHAGMSPPDRLEQATVCLKEGMGNRETSRLTGTCKKTVAKLRLILEKENGGPFLCMCGLPAVHRGMCPVRSPQTA